MTELDLWIAARDRCELTDAQALMARELHLNPADLHRPEKRADPWKRPLPQYISDLYQRRFKRDAPLRVVPLEELRDDWASTMRTKIEARRRERPAGQNSDRPHGRSINFRDSHSGSLLPEAVGTGGD